MGTCIVDEAGYCQRHERVHEGRLLELALMDNELGESYRQLWDRQLAEKKAAPVGAPAPIGAPKGGSEPKQGGCGCGRKLTPR